MLRLSAANHKPGIVDCTRGQKYSSYTYESQMSMAIVELHICKVIVSKSLSKERLPATLYRERFVF